MTATRPTELTSDQVIDLLHRHGRKINESTWHSYVHRGDAPRPTRHLKRTPLWDEDAVLNWNVDPAAWRTRTQQGAIDTAVTEARRQIVAALEDEAARLTAERQDPALGSAYTVSESFVSGIEHAAMIAHRARATTTKEPKP